MEQMDKLLRDAREKIDQISAPADLDEHLRTALSKVKTKKSKRKNLVYLIAAAVILLTFASFNFQAIAYYSKTLLGFDEVVNGTLQQLNEDGLGQVIDKTYELEHGIELTINGVISDENRFILYYTVKNNDGDPIAVTNDDKNAFIVHRVTGLFTNSFAEYGTSQANDDHTEVKATSSFEAVSPFAKELTLEYGIYGENDEFTAGEVTFPYYPNEALTTKLKRKINQKVTVDDGTLYVKEMIATPTMTVIKGTIKTDQFDRFSDSIHQLELIVDGKRYEAMVSSGTSKWYKKIFDIRFDALPEQFETVSLNIEKFIGYTEVNKQFKLQNGKLQQFQLTNEDELIVRDAQQTERGLEITIESDSEITLEGVSVIDQLGRNIELNTTINEEYIEQNNQTQKIRTLLFETDKAPIELHIKGFRHLKRYDYMIPIIK